MKKVLLIISICFYSYCNSPKIQPDFLQQMNETNDNSTIPVYILFNDHLTLNDLSDIGYDTPREERRKIVIERLQNFANNYQYNVRDFLELKKSPCERSLLL